MFWSRNRKCDVLERDDDHERRTEGKYNSAYGMNGMLDIGYDARFDVMTYYMI